MGTQKTEEKFDIWILKLIELPENNIHKNSIKL